MSFRENFPIIRVDYRKFKMAQGKAFGDIELLLTIFGILIGVGVAFMLFAVVYKLLTMEGNGNGFLFDSNKPHRNSVGQDPTHASSNENPSNFTTETPQPPRLNLRESLPSGTEVQVISCEEDEFEVDAVILSNRTKVPKHGREIITPRATVVPIAEAQPYESDLESQVGSTRSDHPIPHVTLDRRAPSWYND